MKGISPVITIVIIVAFVIAIAGIVGLFMTEFVTDTTNIIAQDIDESVDCSGTALKINDVSCNEDNRLLGMWHFEETSGTVASDSSGSGRDINLTSPTRVAGKSGNALDFNGNNYGAVQNGNSLTPESFTIEAWVYNP